jgi:hypothetical protein
VTVRISTQNQKLVSQGRILEQQISPRFQSACGGQLRSKASGSYGTGFKKILLQLSILLADGIIADDRSSKITSNNSALPDAARLFLPCLIKNRQSGSHQTRQIKLTLPSRAVAQTLLHVPASEAIPRPGFGKHHLNQLTQSKL